MALKYVKRGYTFLMSYLLTIALVPLSAMLLVRTAPASRAKYLASGPYALARVSLAHPMTPSVILSCVPINSLSMLYTWFLPSLLCAAQLELVNMYRKGELLRLVAVAKQTDLTFNLVRASPTPKRTAQKPYSSPRVALASLCRSHTLPAGRAPSRDPPTAPHSPPHPLPVPPPTSPAPA